MNHFKKIYCRTFQAGLRFALPFLPYRKPKILGSVKSIPEVLEKHLAAAGIPYFIYDKTVANPTTDNVADALALYKTKLPLLIAIPTTAGTGMDALTHAIEAFIGNSTTPGTRKDALHAAYYAGCAFTKSYVGYVHAIAHSLGGEYNVPHGLAIAAGITQAETDSGNLGRRYPKTCPLCRQRS